MQRKISLVQAHPPKITLPEYNTAWDALAAASQISGQLNQNMAKKPGQNPDPVETLGSIIECADAVQQALVKANRNQCNPNHKKGMNNGFTFFSGITSILLGRDKTRGIISTPAILGLDDILDKVQPSDPSDSEQLDAAKAAYDTVLEFYNQKYPQRNQ